MTGDGQTDSGATNTAAVQSTMRRQRRGYEPSEARIDAWVARQLANAPPLNSEQRDLLCRLLVRR